MKPRIGLTITLAVLLGLFTAANWSAFTAPATLSLLVTQFQAPLGMVLLAIVALVMLAYLALLALADARSARDLRRMGREIERLRKLAETEEDSRYVELRAYIESRLAVIETKLDEMGTPRRETGPATQSTAVLVPLHPPVP